ncbi:peptidoglycan-binding protein [Sulfitobacter pseudonitzschiae]|nr:peptidoglycan-binding protein [Pseudosulfitobacter pseudonitzschiae]MBM1830732.1 peptidoglycan-binding protein [Pseudosulfitobacter pseudonitzschiae]MBM1835599.1 peptidoglycan-binding protein [Pseudosulfitobacter pseudonitzschiae]MBM1840445.1 peptidoglycan-binding protein [Pseudosulfitobacter pseudonitzschiae]MBM1845567.1 peptidoglycan-binding protein [Pseudosulfitobacter pseudonitzschiae]
MSDGNGLDGPGMIRLTAERPEGAAPDSCWGKKTSPAIIETVEREVLLKPAQVTADGVIQQPAVYRRESVQEIVQERVDTWFQVPCAADLTPEFVSSLQRALAARNIYHGPVNGEMTMRTRAAVRRFQAPDGFDSDILTIATARKLGLVAVERQPAE